MFLLSPPSSLRLPSLKPPLNASSFINGSFPLIPKPSTLSQAPSPASPSVVPVIKAMKKMQGRVVCATNDKTVAVEVTRIFAHPKYKRRIKSKKKYQAHDADNQFKVGDVVQLETSRPISKTKSFVAIPVVPRSKTKPSESVPQELSLPLQAPSSSSSPS